MRTFVDFFRKKEQAEEELVLRTKEPERSFDVYAALAKALLLFLIVYGAVGAFLSAYEMEYNKGICMLLIFAFGFFLSSVYETGKKWLMNLMNILVLIAYFYIAIANYWVINSGYYAIMNRILEVAREYLNIANGADYALMVEDEYTAVSVFVLFIGMVGCILLNIHMQNKVSLVKVVVLTFSPFVFPFYFGRTPDLIYIIFLLTGYTTVAVINCTDVRKKISGQMRYVLPVAAVFVLVVIRVTAFVIPRDVYESFMPENSYKPQTKKAAAAFAQFGMMSLFQGQTSGGGVSGGVLGQGAGPMADYETDLIVRYTPYSYQAVYLKAFTGKNYEGDHWSAAGDFEEEDIWMTDTVAARVNAYYNLPEEQGRGIMEIENVGASRLYEYRPYYTDSTRTVREDNITTYTYFPSGGKVVIPVQETDPGYLTVPDRCRDAVANVCAEAGFQGTPEEVANQIVTYLKENYSYTLRPGYNFRGVDYITYFLRDSKRGYCAHFASAGTMLFRYMGIPARYVEGYAFSYYDVVDSAELVEDADYADYYSGYMPFGETAVVQLEIPDARAHGWVEIYIDGRGWIVVDPTPASTETETTSFWEAFMNNGQGQDENQITMGADTIGAYLEKAIGGISYILVIGGIVVLVFVGARYGSRIRREKELSMRQQVWLEYGKLKKEMLQKHQKFAMYRTVKEQLDFVREHYKADIPEEQEEALYRAFFGQEENEYDQILHMLKSLRRTCRKRAPGK